MTNTRPPWNKGLKMGPMKQSSKDKISKANKGKNIGPKPNIWITGPDPVVHRLRRRFILARNQARFWQQKWLLSWDQYRDLLLDHAENLGKTAEELNLCREDKTEVWSIGNVQIMTRSQAVRRKKLKDKNGKVISRTNTKQLKERKNGKK